MVFGVFGVRPRIKTILVAQFNIKGTQYTGLPHSGQVLHFNKITYDPTLSAPPPNIVALHHLTFLL